MAWGLLSSSIAILHLLTHTRNPSDSPNGKELRLVHLVHEFVFTLLIVKEIGEAAHARMVLPTVEKREMSKE